MFPEVPILVGKLFQSSQLMVVLVIIGLITMISWGRGGIWVPPFII